MTLTLDPHLQPLLLELATVTRAQATPVTPTLSEEERALEQAQQELERMRSAASAARLAVADMELEILRIQEDERKLRRRATHSKQQLGATSDPELRKDLQHDIYTAKSRIADLMSELQEAHNEIHALRQNVDKHDARLQQLEENVQRAQEAVTALPPKTNQADRAVKIAELRAQLPQEALDAFDEQRAEDGVGVAAFNGRTCGGCFIVLPPADIARINASAENLLPHCPDCGSYLVSTR